MSAGLVLTAGVATVRRTSSSRTIHDVEEGSASGVFWRLRDRPSSGLKSQDRDFRWFSLGLGLANGGRDKPWDMFVRQP